MKYKPKTYAQALVDSLVEKKTDDKKIAVNFLKLLKKNQDLKKALSAIILAENLLLKKTGNKKITLETARETDVKDILKTFIKKGDIVEEKINPALIAGVKIIVDGNQQLDVSLARKLENIF